MQVQDRDGRWRRDLDQVIRPQIEAGRHDRRRHAANRSKTGALIRVGGQRSDDAPVSERAARFRMRRLLSELGLLKEDDVWGHGFKIRSSRTRPRVPKKPKARPAKGAGRQLLTYRRPLKDRRGRVAVYMKSTYLGLRSPNWKAGLAADHVLYLLRDDAIDREHGRQGWTSNMGKNAGEIADAWDAIEAVERNYRANAMVQNRLVINMPDGLTPRQREKCLKKFCERAFGRYGLPYLAVLHKPDPGGNKRNFHAHVTYSTRPMQRLSESQWHIAEEKVSCKSAATSSLGRPGKDHRTIRLACHCGSARP